MVFALQAIGDDDLGGIGPAMFLALLTVYYGLIMGYLVSTS